MEEKTFPVNFNEDFAVTSVVNKVGQEMCRKAGMVPDRKGPEELDSLFQFQKKYEKDLPPDDKAEMTYLCWERNFLQHNQLGIHEFREAESEDYIDRGLDFIKHKAPNYKLVHRNKEAEHRKGRARDAEEDAKEDARQWDEVAEYWKGKFLAEAARREEADARAHRAEEMYLDEKALREAAEGVAFWADEEEKGEEEEGELRDEEDGNTSRQKRARNYY